MFSGSTKPDTGNEQQHLAHALQFVFVGTEDIAYYLTVRVMLMTNPNVCYRLRIVTVWLSL